MNDNYRKGRGSQINTHNPYLKQKYVTEHAEGLDEDLIGKRKTELFYEHPRKIVSITNSPDLGLMHSINPYQGCEHGCVYCYARNSHQYWGFSAGLDFESKIIVKPKAAEMLEKYLVKLNGAPTPIVLSGNTDCYQPTERKLKITRSLLLMLAKYRHPVGIITKNSLILRDLDVLRDLASDRLIHVYQSITSLNESLRRVLEPRTASAKKKLKVMEELTKAGIPVGVMTAPIIPGLNEHEIPELIKQVAAHGAQTAGYTIVRLNGSIAALFKDWLYKNFPERADKVWHKIKECHGGAVNDSQWFRRNRGDGPIAEAIKQLFRASVKKHMPGRKMPEYDLTKFRKGGNFSLF
ncbi:MAG: PA0069 family radical SAM protein [Cyclobacteriaceae bacterium]